MQPSAPYIPLSTRFFRSLPVRVKLLVIIFGICAGALLLSLVLETALSWTTERKRLLNRLSVTAEVISRQSRAAIEFLDRTAARENLESLDADPTIVQACFYDESGKEFAFYTDKEYPGGAAACPQRSPAGYTMRWNYIDYFYDIVRNDRTIGTLYLRRDLHDVFEYINQQTVYRFGILLLIFTVIWPIYSYFQRMISLPILDLASITRRFSSDRHQPLKAVKMGEDEIGDLADALNAMMEEIRRNESRLSQAINELSRSNTELERFAHICSHDLQEPLRMVSNYTSLLERRMEGKLDEETAEYMAFIRDGVNRMRELIHDILTYARITHRVEPMRLVDTNTLVNQVLNNLDASIKERDAHIHKGELPEIFGNRTLLIQIFQNLISNGIKFSKKAPEVLIGATRKEDSWEFCVKDNGIGINPKYHGKIFEIFKRLNRREEFQGTGIGLAIVKKAVEYHQGRIWVESEAEKGTTFFFTIPDKKEDKAYDQT